MSKVRVLVTGGAGFIGSALVNKLAVDPNYRITVVDNLLTGNQDRLKEADNIQFVKADVNKPTDITTIFHSQHFDYVFHYAAVVGVKRTLENPIKVLDDISGVRNVLDLSKNSSVKRVFFSSSSEVYGEPVELPQNEHTTPLNSRLPYAIVKNVGEAFIRSYKQEFNLDYTIFRFFNTYGPQQSSDFVISKFIAAALAGDPITIYGDGSQTRTFCYIEDNIAACLKAFKNNECIDDVVNIGSDKEITILELAKKIIELSGSKSEIVHLPALEEGDMSRRLPDNRKMKGLLGRDLIPLDQGLGEVLKDPSFFLK
jgi:UDP-glucose 4-epimerase